MYIRRNKTMLYITRTIVPTMYMIFSGNLVVLKV